MLELYSHTYPVARKGHECEFCHCVIPKGKRYSYESGKFDGDMFTRKLCPECNGMLHDYYEENRDEEFDWCAVSDWLSDTYCYGCPNCEECNVIPEQCDIIRGNFPSEIPKKFNEIVN